MNLIAGSHAVLQDALYFLQKISAAQYHHPIPILSDATIGQHTRHFIEFYQCLLAQAPQQNINYCLRSRNPQIEQDPRVAAQAIEVIRGQLDQLALDQSVTLFTAKEGGSRIPSTLARELYYNVEHTIHHLALIKVGLKTLLPELELPSHFGVAPSTLQHRKMALSQS